ncbi:MAG: hypothetical protein IPH31_24630 [Lewinellaceae bacterium]|nr:hypothetical protein [Lewinellaceae bacterium]
MEGKKANARTEHFLEGNIFAPTIEDIKSELLAVKAPVQHLGNDVEAFAKEWIRSILIISTGSSSLKFPDIHTPPGLKGGVCDIMTELVRGIFFDLFGFQLQHI